jgi:protein-S-isoprenylcysteine O-methyltransferase Ste14
MLLNHILLGSLWIVYCVLHSVLASVSLKKSLQQSMKKGYQYYRLYYTVFAFAGLVGLIWMLVNMQSKQLFELSSWILISGLVISFAGLMLMIICIQKYFLSLSGVEKALNEEHANKLIISGVHKYIRHPLYLGTFAFIWGLFLLLPNLSFLIVNAVITIYTLIGIELEEQKLITEFGDDYRQYQQNVPKIMPQFKFGKGNG